MKFLPPPPLLVGRLVFDLDSSHGLTKTTTNFIALCTGEKGMCKNAPNKKLHFIDCPIHRIVSGFVAQGGDVTRGDGSGGEVCTHNLIYVFSIKLPVPSSSRYTVANLTMRNQDLRIDPIKAPLLWQTLAKTVILRNSSLFSPTKTASLRE